LAPARPAQSVENDTEIVLVNLSAIATLPLAPTLDLATSAAHHEYRAAGTQYAFGRRRWPQPLVVAFGDELQAKRITGTTGRVATNKPKLSNSSARRATLVVNSDEFDSHHALIFMIDA